MIFGVRSHLVALIAALLIGLTFGLPHILIPLMQGHGVSYAPITTKTTFKTDDAIYAAEVRQVRDGHWIVNDPYLYEYMSSPNARAWGIGFDNLILGGLALVTKSVPTTFVLGSFAFPTLTFLLTYSLIYRWTLSRPLGIAGSVIMLLGVQLVNLRVLPTWSNVAAFYHNIKASMDPLVEFNTFARMPIIQFVFIEFAAALRLFFEALQRRSKSHSILAGILFGLLFYSYFYYWALFLSGAVILLSLLFASGRRESARCLTLILAVGMAISVPHWASFIQFRMSPHFEDISSRIGLELGRDFDPLSLRYLVFGILFVILGLRDGERLESLLLGSFILGGIAGLNAQVLLGYNIQSGHWTVRVLDPLMILAWTYLAHRAIGFVSARSRNSMGANFIESGIGYVSLALSALFIAYACSANLAYARNTYRYQTLPQTTLEAYKWLDEHTQRDDVVLSLSIENTILIPVYTHNKVFLPHAWVTSAPTDEILDRLYIAYRLFDIQPSYLANLMNQDNAYADWVLKLTQTKHPDIGGYEKAFWNLTFFGFKYLLWQKYTPLQYDYPTWVKASIRQGRSIYFIPTEVRQRVLRQYAAYPRNVALLLTRYRVDYVYCGPYERSIAQVWPSEVSSLTKVYGNGSIEIYKVQL